MSIEFLYLVISLTLIIIAIVISVVGYHLVQTLKIIQQLVDHSTDIVKDIRLAKNSAKAGVLSGVIQVLNIFRKGGE